MDGIDVVAMASKEYQYTNDKTSRTIYEIGNDMNGEINAVETFCDTGFSHTMNCFMLPLTMKHKGAMLNISQALKRTQESQELTEELKINGLDTLRENYSSYRIRDNSDLVVRIAERCIYGNANCSSFELFLASISQSEMDSIVKSTKECLLDLCTILLQILTNPL